MLSVLIATHNGADTLGRTLQRLTEIDSPPGGWKLIIVNNASTDETKDIILSFASKLPLEYLEETRRGKSFAQNAGMGRVEGDFLICSDDDVLPAADWLVEWRAGVDRHPEASFFGGTIEPYYETAPPTWLAKTVWAGMFFAQTDPTLAEGKIADPIIFGPNMGMRAWLVDSGVRFSDKLGGGDGLMGEETELISRLLRQGHQVCFLPRARVRHIVQKSQMNWRWMLKRCHRHGRTLFVSERMEAAREFPHLFGVPRYLVRRLGENILKLPFVVLRLDAFILFRHLRLIAYDLGAARQARQKNPDPRVCRTKATPAP